MAESTKTVETNGENGGNASEPENRRSFFKLHPKAKWVILIVAIILIGGGIYVFRYYSTHISTDDAQINGDIYPISSRISGHVIAVNVQDNEYVKKGTVLVRLDPTDYKVALERTQGDYAMAVARAKASQVGVPITSVHSSTGISSAEARVEQAQAAIQASEKQYLAAKAKIDQTKANYVKAKSDLARYAMLVKKDEVSQQQYVHALQTAQADSAAVTAAESVASATEQEVSQAHARLAQAKADLRASHTGPQRVLVSRADAEAAQAAVKIAKANLDQSQLNVGYTTIRAPISGIVGKKSVEVGQNIEAGQALMAVVPVTGLWVTANYKETKLKGMRPGDPATIHVDAYNRDYKGHVLDIAGATGEKFSLLPPENATGNYVKVVQRIPVRITFDPGQDRHHRLRIGMSVEPTVIIKK